MDTDTKKLLRTQKRHIKRDAYNMILDKCRKAKKILRDRSIQSEQAIHIENECGCECGPNQQCTKCITVPTWCSCEVNTKCPECLGLGVSSITWLTYCITELQTVRCSYCSGTGEPTCPTHRIAKLIIECKHCNNSGKIVCNECICPTCTATHMVSRSKKDTTERQCKCINQRLGCDNCQHTTILDCPMCAVSGFDFI
jgi:hypothetical protein